MRVKKEILLEYKGRKVRATALFDTGSSFTIMSTSKFRTLFGHEDWFVLDRPYYGYLINGQKIRIDKYVIMKIIIDDNELVEMVFLFDDYIEKTYNDKREIIFPDMIIGSGTMDKYNIELSPEGIEIKGILLL